MIYYDIVDFCRDPCTYVELIFQYTHTTQEKSDQKRVTEKNAISKILGKGEKKKKGLSAETVLAMNSSSSLSLNNNHLTSYNQLPVMRSKRKANYNLPCMKSNCNYKRLKLNLYEIKQKSLVCKTI